MSAEATLRSRAGGPQKGPDGFVPDMQRRTLMNYLLLASTAGPVGLLGGGFLFFFYP